MKIVITGSLGHIGKPLVSELVQKGHSVTVITSSPARKEEIESLGAIAAVGDLEDTDFLTEAFTGADAVYSMVPPNNYTNQNLDLIAYYKRLGSNYAQAIKQSGVKRVVNLSTIGAHMEKGNGILHGAHNVEKLLNVLPADVSITHMRPVSFNYNLYGYTHMIKNLGYIAANYGADKMIPWVSPIDIAAAVADELTTPFTGRKIRYVASEELTGHETAAILGEAIGKPDLEWVLISDGQTLDGLLAAGLEPKIAAGLVEMYAALYNGSLGEDYIKNRPAVMGNVKMIDFAKEFAVAYQQI